MLLYLYCLCTEMCWDNTDAGTGTFYQFLTKTSFLFDVLHSNDVSSLKFWIFLAMAQFSLCSGQADQEKIQVNWSRLTFDFMVMSQYLVKETDILGQAGPKQDWLHVTEHYNTNPHTHENINKPPSMLKLTLLSKHTHTHTILLLLLLFLLLWPWWSRSSDRLLR